MNRNNWSAEYWKGRPKVDDDGVEIPESTISLLRDAWGAIEELQEITGYEVNKLEAADHADNGSEYPENWNQISTRIKELRGWRCEECGFTSPGSATIQVHHIDHDKADCSIANLQVLCLICHATKHGGGTGMGEFVSADAREEMNCWHRTQTRKNRKLND